MDDLKANTEYTVYTAASNCVQWFWEVVKGFNKEDRARLLQFVTGTSKVTELQTYLNSFRVIFFFSFFFFFSVWFLLHCVPRDRQGKSGALPS